MECVCVRVTLSRSIPIVAAGYRMRPSGEYLRGEKKGKVRKWERDKKRKKWQRRKKWEREKKEREGKLKRRKEWGRGKRRKGEKVRKGEKKKKAEKKKEIHSTTLSMRTYGNVPYSSSCGSAGVSVHPLELKGLRGSDAGRCDTVRGSEREKIRTLEKKRN